MSEDRSISLDGSLRISESNTNETPEVVTPETVKVNVSRQKDFSGTETLDEEVSTVTDEELIKRIVQNSGNTIDL